MGVLVNYFKLYYEYIYKRELVNLLVQNRDIKKKSIRFR